jgi:hypothetical protein
VKCKFAFLFQHHQSQIRATLLQLPRRGESHNSAANYGHIKSTHKQLIPITGEREIASKLEADPVHFSGSLGRHHGPQRHFHLLFHHGLVSSSPLHELRVGPGLQDAPTFDDDN